MAGRQPALGLLGEDRPVTGPAGRVGPGRAGLLTCLVAALVLVLGACGPGGPGGPDRSTGSGDPDQPGASGTPGGSPAPSPSATAAPPAPTVGSCHDLSLAGATRPVDTGGAVACTRPHTSVTVEVGRLSALADGHLLSVDSRAVRARVARACPSSLVSWAGGTTTAQRLSRLEVVWFTPTLEQADAGADWFRCDLVSVASSERLQRLPGRARGLLRQASALDTYGTCGTSAPDARTFERVACVLRHTWRAVGVVPLPGGSTYLDAAVTARGDDRCRSVASDRAGGDLELTWSFEWPTRDQWDAGQRYGWCWVPTSA